MRRFTTALVAMVAALSPSLFAQWPLHPLNVPKGPDGKPNLARACATNCRRQAGLLRSVDDR